MPTKEQHVLKATENESFARSLDENSQVSINWKLVVLFYVAVHYVEAYLAKSLGVHLRSHTTRDNYITREANLRKIRIEYNHLKFFAYNARYEPDQFTKKDVQSALNYLGKVELELKPFI